MSELMLEAVLRMPPNLWRDDPIDVKQRHSRYIQAADELTTLRTQLAASEARERQLREAIQAAVKFQVSIEAQLIKIGYSVEDLELHKLSKMQAALALPTDTTALREVCLRVAREVASGRAIRLVDIVDEVLGK